MSEASGLSFNREDVISKNSSLDTEEGPTHILQCIISLKHTNLYLQMAH